IAFLLAEAVTVRTRILGRAGGLLCQSCFRLRVKRTEETGGGESQIKHCTRGTAQHNRGIKRKESIPHLEFMVRGFDGQQSRSTAGMHPHYDPKHLILMPLNRPRLLPGWSWKQTARFLPAVVLTSEPRVTHVKDTHAPC